MKSLDDMPSKMPLPPALQATLQAVAGRIIPADEYPGAWEAGVRTYLEHQFQHDLAAHLWLYEKGLLTLDNEAKAQYGQAFVELSEAGQDVLLTLVAAGDVQTAWEVSPPGFFQMVLQHVAEGYYGPPAEGSDEMESWIMLGFQERCEPA